MFHDRNNFATVYEVGQVVDFIDKERVDAIVKRGLGVIVEENLEVSQTPVNEQHKEETPKVGVGGVETPKKASTKKTMKKR